MKKNVLLFGVLVVLLGITFFFQEQRSRDEYFTGMDRNRIIPGEFQQIKLGNSEITKRDNQWWSDDVLISHNFMKQLEKKLSEIKEVKKISGGEWKDYFTEPLSFEVDEKKYTLGNLSLDRKNFYIAQGDVIMLARIEGESSQLTTEEEEMDALKYEELKSLVLRNVKAMKENQLFRYYTPFPVGQVASQMDGRLDYELDLKENTTTPPPISGIAVHENLQQKFISLLTQVTMKEEIPFSESLKFKKLGSLNFTDKDEKLTWDLWLKGKDSADAVIIDEKNKRAYLMIGGTLKVFFIHLQDYWDKKVIPPQKFESFRSLRMTFSQGDKSQQVQLINAEPLRFEAEGAKVKTESMMELINLLFNLGPRDQADRISQLSQAERKELLSGEHLRVEVWGEDILFWKKAQEVILVNLTQGYKAHFTLPDKTIEFKFQDVIK